MVVVVVAAAFDMLHIHKYFFLLTGALGVRKDNEPPRRMG